MRFFMPHYIQSGTASENSFAAFPFLAASEKGLRGVQHKSFVEPVIAHFFLDKAKDRIYDVIPVQVKFD